MWRAFLPGAEITDISIAFEAMATVAGPIRVLDKNHAAMTTGQCCDSVPLPFANIQTMQANGAHEVFWKAGTCTVINQQFAFA